MGKEQKKRDKERRDLEFHLRMSKSEMALLEMLSYEDEKSKAETFIKALNFYANLKKSGF